MGKTQAEMHCYVHFFLLCNEKVWEATLGIPEESGTCDDRRAYAHYQVTLEMLELHLDWSAQVDDELRIVNALVMEPDWQQMLVWPVINQWSIGY